MPLADVFRESRVLSQPRVKVIGSAPFTYVIEPNLDSYEYVNDDEDNVLWQVASSTCQSLDLQIGVSTDQPIGVDRTNLSDIMKISTQAEASLTLHLPVDQVTNAHVALTPGEAFAITLSGSYYIFINGSGNCTAPLSFS